MAAFDPHDVETRVTDEKSGGQKGTKLTQIGALDPVALIEVGRVAGMGAQKYAPFNYLKGFDWSLLYNAAMRHANLFWAGEDIDPESGLSHAAHAAWMFLALVSFQHRKIGQDDRPPAFVKPPVEWRQLRNLHGGGHLIKTCRSCGAAEGQYHALRCVDRVNAEDPYVDLGGEG